MNNQTKAEKFCKLNNIHKHSWDFIDDRAGYTCDICGRKSKYTYDFDSFTDAKSIIDVMDKRPDGKLFYAHLMYSGDNVEAIDDDGYIDRDYIKNPDKLLDEAISWCEKGEERDR